MTTVNPDSSVYYHSGYWNDLAAVRDHVGAIATGDAGLPWYQHLLQWRGRPFRKALFVNCGNGWVERELIKAGVVLEGVGIDYSDDLLDGARAEAAKDDLPLRYYQMDTNSAEFPEDGYDLVVNFAAMHHLAYLDRVLRKLCSMLPDDGVLVSHDYFGPHRNQYTEAQWAAAVAINREIPEEFRQDLQYPHLPTMLVSDPTEAIHSELILPTIRRYFTVEYERMLGGGIAYLLLTFNRNVFDRPVEDSADVVKQILAADEAFTALDPAANTLFGYQIATVNKAALNDPDTLERWALEEETRERRATDNGGTYYPPTVIGDLFVRLEVAERERAAFLARAEEAETAHSNALRQLTELHNSKDKRAEAGISDEAYAEYTTALNATDQARAAAAAVVAATDALKSVLQPAVAPTGRQTMRARIAKIPGTRKVYHALRRHDHSS